MTFSANPPWFHLGGRSLNALRIVCSCHFLKAAALGECAHLCSKFYCGHLEPNILKTLIHTGCLVCALLCVQGFCACSPVHSSETQRDQLIPFTEVMASEGEARTQSLHNWTLSICATWWPVSHGYNHIVDTLQLLKFWINQLESFMCPPPKNNELSNIIERAWSLDKNLVFLLLPMRLWTNSLTYLNLLCKGIIINIKWIIYVRGQPY